MKKLNKRKINPNKPKKGNDIDKSRDQLKNKKQRKINETNWPFLWNINKIDIPPAKLTKTEERRQLKISGVKQKVSSLQTLQTSKGKADVATRVGEQLYQCIWLGCSLVLECCKMLLVGKPGKGYSGSSPCITSYNCVWIPSYLKIEV